MIWFVEQNKNIWFVELYLYFIWILRLLDQRFDNLECTGVADPYNRRHCISPL